MFFLMRTLLDLLWKTQQKYIDFRKHVQLEQTCNEASNTALFIFVMSSKETFFPYQF